MLKKLSNWIVICVSLFIYINAYATTLPYPYIAISDTLSSETMGNLVEYNGNLFLIGVDAAKKSVILQFNDSLTNPKWSAVSDGLPKEYKSINMLSIVKQKLFIAGINAKNPEELQSYIAEYKLSQDKKYIWEPLSTKGLPNWSMLSKMIDFNGNLIANVMSGERNPLYLFDSSKQTWSPMPFIAEQVTDIAVFRDKLYMSNQKGIYVYKDNQWQSINNGLPNYKDKDGAVITGYYNNLVVFNDTLFVDGCLVSTVENNHSIQHGILYAYNGNDSAPQWTEMTSGLPINYVYTTVSLLKYDETPTVIVKDISLDNKGEVFSLGKDNIWHSNENFPKNIMITQLLASADHKKLYLQVMENNHYVIYVKVNT